MLSTLMLLMEMLLSKVAVQQISSPIQQLKVIPILSVLG